MLKLYNTLSRKQEVFKPISNDEVLMYACGPTVYHYAHIGNLRTYVFEDLLKRALIYNNLKVKHVINITDVGHLTSDADEGEDKLEKEAKLENKSVWDIALFYTNAFKQDFKKLNLIEPNVWCKATDNIKEQIELVQCLEKKGYTYKTSDGIYFDTSKFKSYGKLAKLKKSGLKAGARIEMGEKKNITDFALWKFSPKDQKRQMEWDSPFGKGFPGWHIECSAMAMKFLGNNIDIHCGGIDHIPVHHSNEIAQSEGCLGKKWVNYWLHGDFLVINKEKMAKSGANFLTLQELEKHGYTALDYRYFCLTAHYRTQLNFSFEDLDSARNAYNKLKSKIIEFRKGNESVKKSVDAYKKDFLKSINEDLNTPKALAVVWDLVKDEAVPKKDKYDILIDFDKVLGLKLDEAKEEEVKTSDEVNELLRQREEARKNKDFKKADELRDKIRDKGYMIEDSAEGLKLKPIK